MSLLKPLRARAVELGLFPSNELISAPSAFALVRDMPYERASSRAPEVTIAEWRGTCSGKHFLLRELFAELGFPTTLIACTHEFTLENATWAPAPLRAILAEGPIPDVHNFLRLQCYPNTERADEWMTVDATWPRAGTPLGLPVNEHFELGRDHEIACDPIEVFHLPDGEDPQVVKERLVELHVGEQRARRERFIEALCGWLAEVAGDSPSPDGAADRGHGT
ncbi:MAG: hypothetical protein FJZ92_07215 [Chloroflexi bacterium]|nr:hypothetical protein [Chloroflexota bacterium]